MAIYKSNALRMLEMENENRHLQQQLEQQQARTDYIAMMTDLDELNDEEEVEDDEHV